MFAGIAGGLLVFTGLWHATEWMMDGRRRDTWALVPVGILYLILGALIALGIGGMATQIIAAGCVAVGGGMAFVRRAQLDIRRWVIWAFIVIDVAIVMAVLGAVLR